jgi:Mn-dependent DtxR family transcriptional regulator
MDSEDDDAPPTEAEVFEHLKELEALGYVVLHDDGTVEATERGRATTH